MGDGRSSKKIRITLRTYSLCALWSLISPGCGILSPKLSPDLWFPMDSMTSTNLLGREVDASFSGEPSLVPGVFLSGLQLNMGETMDLVYFSGLHDTCLADPSNCPGLTVALWIKLGPPRSSFVTYLSSEGATTLPTGMSLYQEGGGLSAAVTTVEKRYNATVDPMNHTGQWAHIVITWKPNWGLDFFINGKMIVYDANGRSHNLRDSGNGDLVLGSSFSAAVTPSTSGSAVFDNLMVWYKQLAELEVLDIYSEEHNLRKASSQNLTPGIPFKVLMEDQDLATCATLQSQSSSSQRSMIVELKWISWSPEAGMSNVRIEFSGSYNVDYLKVYAAGDPQEDECSRLTPCEIEPNSTSTSAHWSTIYYCACPNYDCVRFFLSTTSNGCDVSWTSCEPIKVCSASLSGEIK